MHDRPPALSELLRRCHVGDRDSLSTLVQRHLPALRDLVHRRLAAGLRRVGDAEDFLEDAMVEVLRHAPELAVVVGRLRRGEFDALDQVGELPP